MRRKPTKSRLSNEPFGYSKKPTKGALSIRFTPFARTKTSLKYWIPSGCFTSLEKKAKIDDAKAKRTCNWLRGEATQDCVEDIDDAKRTCKGQRGETTKGQRGEATQACVEDIDGAKVTTRIVCPQLTHSPRLHARPGQPYKSCSELL